MFVCRTEWRDVRGVCFFEARYNHFKINYHHFEQTRMRTMSTVDIKEATIHLSRLVDEVASGKSFMISKAGKPLVQVVALNTSKVRPMKRLGFLTGQITVPDDFDQMCNAEINQLFWQK